MHAKKKLRRGEARRGEASRTGPIIIVINNEHWGTHGCALPGLVIRYVLGHSHIRGLLAIHQVRSRGDGRVVLPSLRPIHVNEIENGSETVTVVVLVMVNEVHGDGREILPGS
jgi:hypothetical protein